MTPVESYKRDLEQGGFQYDPAQEKVVHYAQSLYVSLLQRNEPTVSLWQRWWHKPTTIRGLYIWGGVGRGKTWIMDKLHHTLPMQKKCRIHFHQFMQNIHIQLRDLTHQANPLEQVAENIIKQADVLFLDEFHVNDIADAMLCVGLFKALYARGMTLITTSNIKISELYQEGLQRDQFMPVIHLLEKFTTEIELKAGADFRFRDAKEQNKEQKKGQNKEQKDEEVHEAVIKTLVESFNIKAEDYGQSIPINNRSIQTRAKNNSLIWFDFSEICSSPRSTADYLVLANQYQQVIVSDVPQFTENNDSEALRFIHLVDALYDNRVQLKVTTQQQFNDLYHGRLFEFRFERTVSRLTEMHSDTYLDELPGKNLFEENKKKQQKVKEFNNNQQSKTDNRNTKKLNQD
ncbi:ATPase, AFG1 family [hydrothermal vent metagenome]|uniref:ATPase, AFG1 family n=1 Tax=hydrothermal vent metagenome TaxID=652676 RepID=A0A3B0YIC8_9ZZZZ